MSDNTLPLERLVLETTRPGLTARRLRAGALYLVLGLAALVTLLPFYWMMVGSTLIPTRRGRSRSRSPVMRIFTGIRWTTFT